MNAKFFVVTGPWGVGKSTLIYHLMAENQGEFRHPVRLSTRPGDGRISRTDFEDLAAAGGFLESVTDPEGFYHGTPRQEVEAALARGDSIILELDCEAARLIKDRFPAATLIFVTALGGPVVLEARLRRQGLDEDGVAKRMAANAAINPGFGASADRVVANDNLKDGYQEFTDAVFDRPDPWSF